MKKRIMLLTLLLLMQAHTWADVARVIKMGVFGNKPIVFRNDAVRFTGMQKRIALMRDSIHSIVFADKSLDHWLPETTYRKPPAWLIWLIAGVVGLLILVVIMNIILRQRVKRRTADLREQTHRLEREVAARERAEKMMTRSRDFYLTLFDDFSFMIWRADVSTKCNYFNNTWLVFTGRKLEQELNDGWAEGVHPEDLERAKRVYLNAFHACVPFEMEYRLRYHDGSYRWITVVGRPYNDIEGNFSGYIGACFDIQDRKQAEQALRESETRFRAIFDQTFQFIGLLEPDGTLLEANQTVLDFGGFARSDIVGRPFWEAPWWSVSEQTQQQLRDAIAKAAAGEFVRYEVDVLGTQGELATIDFSLKPVRDDSGRVVLLIPEGRDITDRKRAETTLEHQSYHDMLTGLPNRWLLQDRLAQAMAFARREGRKGALLFLDLDRFKHINDTLGHMVGDQLLLAVTSRLLGLMREGDTLARLGGDDFVLLLANVKHSDEVVQIAETLLNHLAQPFTLPGREVRVDACVGIVLFPSDDADSETLLQHAEFAMYNAKQQGRGKYQFYTADTHAQASERFTIEHDLYRAIEGDELVLHYQPQVSLENGDIVGVEALVRWQHPQNGLILPGKFIPVAEETGLIVPLGEWVLRRAVRDFLHWRRQGCAPQRLAINLSVQQLFHTQTVPMLEQIIAEVGLEPAVLELEITESGIMQDPERAVETVRAIKQLGVNVAIDDFGTGYSSLAYLQRFPIDVLKIDQSFIRDINIDKDDETIVETIIAMARTLNLEVIAEGIEAQSQADFLCQRGCEYAQGYLYAYPMSAEALEQFLTAKKQASLR